MAAAAASAVAATAVRQHVCRARASTAAAAASAAAAAASSSSSASVSAAARAGSAAAAPMGAAASAARAAVAGSAMAARWLNLHEYQSKKLLDSHGVNTQRWRLATDAASAVAGAEELGSSEFVVKAQVHAGGRGKGHFEPSGFKGGVQLCKTPAEAGDLTSKMVGQKLITKQTPPGGVPVGSVMIAESLDFSRELYFAILMDREARGPVIVASTEGGMDIETVAEETPEKIFKEPVDIFKGVLPEQTERLARQLGFSNVPQAQEQIARLYDMFLSSDATQVEINPLVETEQGDVYCVDAKIAFDDNAEFRQKDIFSWHDPAEDDPREVAAAKHDLNYIGLDGNIGCMVNGAGLAMATLDIIKLYEGAPANFLDVGGGAQADQIAEAFKIISGDAAVDAILVNIFGGIMRCDVIAQGIVDALKTVDVKQPIVVRLAGTNVELGKRILAESGYDITAADDLDDAAAKAVAATKN